MFVKRERYALESVLTGKYVDNKNIYYEKGTGRKPLQNEKTPFQNEKIIPIGQDGPAGPSGSFLHRSASLPWRSPHGRSSTHG